MEMIVKSRSGKVSDRQRSYIENKLGKLERYLDRISKVTIEVSEEQRRNEGTMHRAQATLVGDHGILLRAEQRATDMYAAIDQMVDALQRQIQRYKDKHWRRGRLRRHGSQVVDVGMDMAIAEAPATTEERPNLVRTKEVQVKPMYSDEAVEQMELLGHDFFLFRDADSDQINLVYRRRDGNYGVLVPSEDAE